MDKKKTTSTAWYFSQENSDRRENKKFNRLMHGTTRWQRNVSKHSLKCIILHFQRHQIVDINPFWRLSFDCLPPIQHLLRCY